MNPPRARQAIVNILIVVALLVIFYAVFIRPRENAEPWVISQVAAAAREGNIKGIDVLDAEQVFITLNDGATAKARIDPNSSVIEQLSALGVTSEQLGEIKLEYQNALNLQMILTGLLTLLPFVIVIVVIYMMLRQAQGSNNQALSFGKSRARMFTGDHPTVTFDDVAGCDEAKEELHEVVEFLREPDKFIQLGARIPKGVLVVGPPGTGKTLLAKAVSGEAGVPFFSISGSEFVEMFVGVGASRVRDLFDQAKRHSPCIVFVDEIDAVGRHRGAGLGGSHDEREQTLNQILVEMDGFDTDTNVIIVAATNRPDILDPALLRPGRFDRRVVLDRPDVKGREEILKVHVRGKPLGNDVELGILAKATPGFVGADIENMVNEAAILAARRNKKTINMPECQEAIERVVMGPERRSRLVTAAERRITAYHEAGHAVVGHYLPNCEPVLKVTIIPRGMAGGYTLAPPADNVWYHSRSKFMDEIAMTLGGRIAEELVLNEITTGARADLEQVTKIARNMVTRYGMSEKLGPMIFGQKEELVFLGREIGEQRDYSESVAEEIDSEVRQIVGEAYEKARSVLVERRDKLELVAETLMEIETLDKDAFAELIGDKKEGNPPENAPSQATPNRGKKPRKSTGTEDASSALDLPPAPAPA
ncbi:MAG: ATP-dependent zinc metalloprotease FtsH [Anaerolineae bacterium]|nr:ATP-dependent zinc metalloprotease FtsH [Anaerolineae bacterium]